MKVRVDTKQLFLKERTELVKKATVAGTRLVANEYRDELKKNFIDASRGSAYDAVSQIPIDGKGSITNHLVVSDKTMPAYFTVGPKLGGMATSAGGSNFKTYEDIFRYNEDGTGIGDPWTFRLKEGRANASPDGYWTTYGIKPKKFFAKTYRTYTSGKLQLSSEIKVRPLIEGVLD